MVAVRALLVAAIAIIGALRTPCVEGAAILGRAAPMQGGRRPTASPAFLSTPPGLLRPSPLPPREAARRPNLAPLMAKKGGAGGGKKKKAGGKKAPFDLAVQKQLNVDKHESECKEMQLTFNATLPSGGERLSFSQTDVETLVVDEGMIGDRTNHPFGSTGLIHYTKEPIFTREECDSVIGEAEEVA
eukprot:CAMPEP_0114122544 /NCGR_PEP_ID=MMETSP0043_2-20121206/7751_1 /TAXON_ID=464988 /ORGANISM="Hemiselmis andersenii, Strain CCMP644" /LENGTH=186 /DNA_ID=CAMNT_0001215265 /DNA_START=128 /DNA_END=685 /DNA_ORIENTATION=-